MATDVAGACSPRAQPCAPSTRPPRRVEFAVEIGEQLLDERLDVDHDRAADAFAVLRELHADPAAQLLRELVGEAHLVAQRLLLLEGERTRRRLVRLCGGVRLEPAQREEEGL